MANVSSERYRLTWMTRSQFVWEKRRHPPRTLKMVANDGERPSPLDDRALAVIWMTLNLAFPGPNGRSSMTYCKFNIRPN